MRNKILIIGCGSQARYIVENIKHRKDLEIVGMVDCEEGGMVGKEINNLKVICHLNDVPKLFDNEEVQLAIGYGNNHKKEEIVEYFKQSEFKFATIINPSAYLSDHIEIGEGVIINANVTIMPNVKIGNFSIIHSHSVIEHDNIIGNYVNIAPGVSFGGNVKIGNNTYIYTGSVVIPKINIGKDVIVGAGTVVIKDIGDGDKVVGNPAKSILRK